MNVMLKNHVVMRFQGILDKEATTLLCSVVIVSRRKELNNKEKRTRTYHNFSVEEVMFQIRFEMLFNHFNSQNSVQNS